MKNAGSSHSPNKTSFVLSRFHRTDSGSTAIEYAVLLGFIVIGGLAAYFGVFYHGERIFDRLASLKEYDTASPNDIAQEKQPGHLPSLAEKAPAQATQADLDSVANRVAIVSCIVIMATILAVGSFLLRRRHRKPKGEPSGDQLANETLQPGTRHCLTEKRQQLRRLFLGKVESSPGFEPQVQHLMSWHLRTIPPEKPVSHVADLMKRHRIRHLLVCDKDGQLLGIISDRDLKKQDTKTAADIMTPQPITVSPDMTVGTAITIMLNHSISCLPVIEHGKVTGLLTTTDLILSLQCSLQILSQLTLSPLTPSRVQPLDNKAPQNTLIEDEQGQRQCPA